MIKRCQEYLKNEKNFKYKDFFILAQGDLSARKFVEASRIGSTYMVTAVRGDTTCNPSLLTVKRLARYTGVDAKELWLKVCSEIFDRNENFIHRWCNNF
jgi:hypothetical protein